MIASLERVIAEGMFKQNWIEEQQSDDQVYSPDSRLKKSYSVPQLSYK